MGGVIAVFTGYCGFFVLWRFECNTDIFLVTENG